LLIACEFIIIIIYMSMITLCPLSTLWR